LRSVDGGTHALLECFPRRDDVVGWQNDLDGIGLDPSQELLSQSQAGQGVAAHRFKDQVLCWQFGELRSYEVCVTLPTHHQNILGIYESIQSRPGSAQERMAALDSQELLGQILTARRPKARARPPRHDHCEDRVRHGGMLPARSASQKRRRRLL
jgi:hypothetical protein